MSDLASRPFLEMLLLKNIAILFSVEISVDERQWTLLPFSTARQPGIDFLYLGFSSVVHLQNAPL
jgi:hypothetical protein